MSLGRDTMKLKAYVAMWIHNNAGSILQTLPQLLLTTRYMSNVFYRYIYTSMFILAWIQMRYMSTRA